MDVLIPALFCFTALFALSRRVDVYAALTKGAEEGLTVMKTYKTGDVPVAHPLLSELPRHVESANKCLATIGNMIGERGARVEKAARDLDAFRLH